MARRVLPVQPHRPRSALRAGASCRGAVVASTSFLSLSVLIASGSRINGISALNVDGDERQHGKARAHHQRVAQTNGLHDRSPSKTSDERPCPITQTLAGSPILGDRLWEIFSKRAEAEAIAAARAPGGGVLGFGAQFGFQSFEFIHPCRVPPWI